MTTDQKDFDIKTDEILKDLDNLPKSNDLDISNIISHLNDKFNIKTSDITSEVKPSINSVNEMHKSLKDMVKKIKSESSKLRRKGK